MIKTLNGASDLYARSKNACDKCTSSEQLIHMKPRKLTSWRMNCRRPRHTTTTVSRSLKKSIVTVELHNKRRLPISRLTHLLRVTPRSRSYRTGSLS